MTERPRDEDDRRETVGSDATTGRESATRRESTASSEPAADAAADPDASGDADREDEEDAAPTLAGIFGARSEEAPSRPALEPGTPSLENAAFVVLGVLLGLFVAYRAIAVLPT